MLALRDYQVEAVDAVLAEYRAGKRSTLLVMPTGTGKTRMAGEIVRRGLASGRSILWLAHREELLTQACAAIERDSGVVPLLERAESRQASAGGDLFGSGAGRVVVASVPTMHARLDAFAPDSFALVIVDEGHHYQARTYRETCEHFSAAKRLLITATPERGDKRTVRDAVDSVAWEMLLIDAWEQGWLVPLQVQRVPNEIDWKAIRTRGGDFVVSDLAEVMGRLDVLRAASTPIVAGLAEGRRALVFCVDVGHAHLQAQSLREVMAEAGVDGDVATVTGRTPDGERARIFADFAAGRVVALTGCDVFSEGTDIPEADTVAMLRPTKSIARYTQMVGRGLRPLPGVVDGLEDAAARRAALAASRKPSALVLDLVGNADGAVDAADLLGDRTDPDVKAARRSLERGDHADLLEALARARALRTTVSRETLAKAGDPFAMFGLVRDAKGDTVPTEAQMAFLRVAIGEPEASRGRVVFDPLANIDKRQASQLIGAVLARRQARLCTVKQMRVLLRAGAPVGKVSRLEFGAASSILDGLAKARWKVGPEWWAARL